jgi:hypothetical protein
MALSFIADTARCFNSQAKVSNLGPAVLLSSNIVPTFNDGEGTTSARRIIVTTNVAANFTGQTAADYELLADDSRSEVSVDISTGKFVKGNYIVGFAPRDLISSDVTDFVEYFDAGSNALFIGRCSTTQSQDYTPGLVSSASSYIFMLTAGQVAGLKL